VPPFLCEAKSNTLRLGGETKLRSNHPIAGTILVADDQSSNRELLEELLTLQGFPVTAASDGASVIEELARVRADLVLLDAVGERTCAPLRSFPLVPIIRHDHEKLDGTGYPDWLRGDTIPITARVLQIVDPQRVGANAEFLR